MKLTLLSQGDLYKVADSVAGDSMSGYFRSHGSRLYVSKQKRFLRSGTNYTEIAWAMMTHRRRQRPVGT